MALTPLTKPPTRSSSERQPAELAGAHLQPCTATAAGQGPAHVEAWQHHPGVPCAGSVQNPGPEGVAPPTQPQRCPFLSALQPASQFQPRFPRPLHLPRLCPPYHLHHPQSLGLSHEDTGSCPVALLLAAPFWARVSTSPQNSAPRRQAACCGMK